MGPSITYGIHERPPHCYEKTTKTKAMKAAGSWPGKFPQALRDHLIGSPASMPANPYLITTNTGVRDPTPAIYMAGVVF